VRGRWGRGRWFGISLYHGMLIFLKLKKSIDET
jgi:hypothetical protein